MTTVLPAASGAAAFSTQNRNGWLNGLSFATTPYGWRRVKFMWRGPYELVVPFTSVISPAKYSRVSAVQCMSPSMPFTALPESTASISARRFACSRTRLAHASRHFARSLMPTLLHSSNPRPPPDREVDVPSHGETSPSLVPVDGSMEKLRPLVASTQRPP
jgi:hypothetical protein